MRRLVAILEDDASRIAAMRRGIADLSPEVELAFFDEARGMIKWLGQHVARVDLISLDHDLPLRVEGGRSVDSGTGREVADFLAAMPPTCPVIVHSSNDLCASAMFFALREAGWTCVRVYPHDHTAWIAGAWIEQVTKQLSASGLT